MFGTRPKSNVDPEVQELTNRMRSKYLFKFSGYGCELFDKSRKCSNPSYGL